LTVGGHKPTVLLMCMSLIAINVVVGKSFP